MQTGSEDHLIPNLKESKDIINLDYQEHNYRLIKENLTNISEGDNEQFNTDSVLTKPGEISSNIFISLGRKSNNPNINLETCRFRRRSFKFNSKSSYAKSDRSESISPPANSILRFFKFELF